MFVYPGWTSTNLDGRCNTLYFEKKGFFETASARLGLPLRVRPTAKPDLTERYLRQALSATSEVAMTLDLARMPGRAPDPAEVPYCPQTVTVSGNRRWARR